MIKIKFEFSILKPGIEFELNTCKWEFGKSIYSNQYRKWCKVHLGIVHFGLFWDDDFCG